MSIMAIRSNFKSLRAKLEAKEGRRISYEEVIKEINQQDPNKVISGPTLVRFANNKVGSVSYVTLEVLCLYFRQRGIECDPGDLLVLELDELAA